MTTPDPQNDLSTKQAAQRLGLPKAADVRKLISLKLLPGAYKDHGTWRIPQSAIDIYLQGQKSKSISYMAPQTWEKFRSHPWIFWPSLVLSGFIVIVGLISILISAGADIDPALDFLYQQGILSNFQSCQEGGSLILIATFHRTEGVVDTNIHGEIERAIQNEINNLDLKDDVCIEIEPTSIPSAGRDAAEDLGRKYGASLIIWGEDTGVRVEVNFLNLKEPTSNAASASLNETTHTQLAQPDAYTRFVTQDLPDKIAFLALFALGQAVQSDLDLSISLLQSAVNLITDYTDIPPEFAVDAAYSRLGFFYYVTGRLDQAVISYSQAIRFNPQDAGFLIMRGDIHDILGNFELAIADYNEAIRLDPENESAFINRGVTYIGHGDYDLAIADFDKALSLNPESSSALLNRGGAYHSQGEYELAIADYSQAVHLAPNYPSPYYNRGLAYDDLGNYDLAIADYNEAIRLSPRNADAFNNRGIIYANQEKFDLAINDYNEAIRLNPRYSSAFINRGAANRELGDYKSAILDYQRYLELTPNSEKRSSVEAIIQELQELTSD